jgi:serine protease Do
MNTKKPEVKFKKNKSRKINFFSANLLVVILMSSLLGGFFSFYFTKEFIKKEFDKLNEISQKLKLEKEANFNFDNYSILEEDRAVISMVKANTKAVVSIVATKDIPEIDSFFNDPFFRQFYFGQPENETETEPQKVGSGTGFIVDSEGYIITNKHVVEDEEANYSVFLNEGESFEAEVLAKDDFLDLAILKIDKKDLPTVKLGNSDELNIGQTVIAIGNSLGEFENTVSKGIVSGLKRQVEAGNSFGKTEVLDEVIQTDAAINPGNSGGPLFNLRGEVIGINVAMASGAENIGFTIPINQVKDIYQSVKETGKIVRPYLGIRYIIINDNIQKVNNLLVNYGALILRGNKRSDLAVVPGSPADKAGLAEYDIILEIDGEEINEKNSLAKVIRKKKVGEEVELKVLSKGNEKKIKVILEKADF